MNIISSYINEAESKLFFENTIKIGISNYHFDSIYISLKDFYATFSNKSKDFQEFVMVDGFIGIDKNKNILYMFRLDQRSQIPSVKWAYKIEKKDLENLDKVIRANNLPIRKVTEDYGMSLLAIAQYGKANFRDYKEYDNFYSILTSSKLKYPSDLKKVPSGFIYRGLSLSRSVIDKIRKNEPFKLNPRKLSSWTTNKSIAEEFVHNGYPDGGIILQTKPNASDIIFNLSNSRNKYVDELIYTFFIEEEFEVLLKGNGIGNRRITEKDIAMIIV